MIAMANNEDAMGADRLTALVYVIERVQIDHETGCWNWTLGTCAAGYGKAKLNHLEAKAHRLSFALFRGAIAQDLVVCHHCDNRACVNPLHLFLGTQAENLEDMRKKGRAPVGIRNGRAKLSPANVREIRALRNNGATLRAISEQFAVSKSTIHAACHGQNWKEVSAC